MRLPEKASEYRVIETMSPSLDIVIVNWNSGEQLRMCIASVAAARANVDVRDVIVVDNASSDGSAENLATASLSVTTLRNKANRGFAAACNQGARHGTAEYLLFLNPDAVLFEDSLAQSLSFMASPAHADVGICGIQLLDDTGNVARSCSRFPTTSMFVAKMLGLEKRLPAGWARQRMSDWDHEASRDVDQVMGAFFLVRRSLFEELGGFDERFFVYFEEVDFSVRAASRGVRSHYLATARARHRGGGCSDRIKAKRLTYNLASRIEFGLKHFSILSSTLLVIATLFVEPFARIAAALMRRSLKESGDTLAGYVELWKRSPEYILRALRRGLSRS